MRIYNGAMSTDHCRRLRAALRHAMNQDTRVLLLGGGQPFCNGIHLGVIEAAEDPAAEAWANIVAIDDVCRDIITCTNQLIVCGVAGNSGAGGVMLALGADRVVLREGVVLNPHYRSMGLYGSEYWTYVLPRRVGHLAARTLTSQCLPIDAAEARRIGLADLVIPGDRATFGREVARYAGRLASAEDYSALLDRKRANRRSDERRRPLREYRNDELSEMNLDIRHDRNGFSRARSRFLRHTPTATELTVEGELAAEREQAADLRHA
jgi:putative two-component system hydrogenase maturation factor HypX/HoxX